MKILVDVTVLVSVVLSLAVTPRILARSPVRSAASRCSWSPLSWLAVVTGLIYLNQVLFTVYVLRVHGGDVSFIAAYFPAGWFDMAEENRALRSIAESFPAPSLLAPTVLRVQAFLELPFVLLAFATVLRWLDAALYRRVFDSPLLPLAAISFTAVFIAVEWELRNPYTADDIVVRAVSAVVTPLLVRRVAVLDNAKSRPLSASGLLLFASSLGALGVGVLTVYDTALLYNLGRLSDRTATFIGGVAALVVLRLAAARLRSDRPAGPAVRYVGHALRLWLVYFLVPALAVRYGISFGTPTIAGAAGLLTVAAASGHALRDTLSSRPDQVPTGTPGEGGRRSLPALLVQLVSATLVGGVASVVAARWAVGSYYEIALLQATAAFLVSAVGACALTDRWLYER